MCGLVWLALLLGISAATCQTPAQPIEGFVTYYGAPEDGIPVNTTKQPLGLLSGACGYQGLPETTWPYWSVVGLASNSSIATAIGANKLGCGSCVKATCTSANCNGNATEGVVLWVADTCEGCQDNQLNVDYTTFQEYFSGDLSLGQLDVTFEQVDCNPPGNISVKVISSRASQGGYIALAFLSVAGSGAIAAVDIRTSGSKGWAPMSNGYGAIWQASRLGVPPLDLRITSYAGEVLIASGAIPKIVNETFPTGVQFGTASAPLPAKQAPAPLTSGLPITLPPDSAAFLGSVPAFDVGRPINAPLYYDPVDASKLITYPGTEFSYSACLDGAPMLNLTIENLEVTNSTGFTNTALAIHTLIYAPFRNNVSSTTLYKLVDYSFYNLETGEFTILFERKYLSLTNPMFLGKTPVEDLDTQETVFPIYRSPAALDSPAGFDYDSLTPPKANEEATPAYLNALEVLYYYLATLTLGNLGSTSTSSFCSQGYAQLGPWADYLREVIRQVAPPSAIVGNYFDNIPLGQDFYFQGTVFTISNALIQGNIIQTTQQLSAIDCGQSCLPNPTQRNASLPVCSAWTYCGSISGCDKTPYKTCDLKNATATASPVSPGGYLNLRMGVNVRYTSGVLSLPAPAGLPLYNFTDNVPGGMVLVSSLTAGA